MFKLIRSDGSFKRAVQISGEHEVVISHITLFLGDSVTHAVFTFTLQNNDEVIQSYSNKEDGTNSKVVRSLDFIARIRELAAATDVDVGLIDSREDFKKAFTGRRLVVDLEESEDDCSGRVRVNIKRFAPTRLKPGTSRA
jgi:hypothetical protein